MATTSAPAPPARRISPADRPSAALDRFSNLAATLADALSGLWITAQQETGLLKYAAHPLFSAAFYTWDVLYRGMVALANLGALVYNTLRALWDVAIRPALLRVFEVLADMFDLLLNPAATVVRAVEYLVRVPLSQLLQWAGLLRGAVAAIPDALQLLRGLVVMLGSMPEVALFGAAVRARDAFAFFVGRTNLVIDWLNAFAHELGILREDRLAWSVWGFSGAVVAGVVNASIPDDLAQQIADALEQWPTRTPADALVDFAAGSPRIQAELDRALAILRGENPPPLT